MCEVELVLVEFSYRNHSHTYDLLDDRLIYPGTSHSLSNSPVVRQIPLLLWRAAASERGGGGLAMRVDDAGCAGEGV